MEKKISTNDLGILSFIPYPFSFKFLIAPLTDIYFFKKFGRKKSYVVPSQYIAGIVTIIFSFKVEQLIEERQVVAITIIGFLIVFCISIQDIALDSWLVTLVRPENYVWGGACFYLAIYSGGLIGFNMVIHFGDVEFCNKYIYSTPQTTPLLTLPTFLAIFGASILIITFILHFFKTEKSALELKQPKSVRDIYQAMVCGSFRNKNVLLFLVFVFFHYSGFMAHESTETFRLVTKGLKKETISELSLYSLPFQIIVALTFPNFVKLGSEIKIMLVLLLLLFIPSVGGLYMVNQYENDQLTQSELAWYYVTISTIGTSLGVILGIAYQVFGTRAADLRATSTYITFQNAINNLGKATSKSLVLFSLDIIPVNTLCYIGYAVQMSFIILISKPLLRLDGLQREDFKITDDDENLPSTSPSLEEEERKRMLT
eukprot:TRINITY_DN8628_c0_g1_i2.p1 TRINITY_DN8628_c0_g1~~TRINITY_DN8628_c0_g1_i2.p1  ORF type:complete len:429 (-),score=53.63 TRINITY_DN8628_c0_g1_i2:132-1418(-)